ncbi:hypothetical protein GLOIN_2v1511284 [Rhizophagus clarus]|uniref:RING-type domain-containing protein n=1 Tax=Rhizophagus clarus TaxID=94130 RepID=A0A8H3LCA7_9GLOM|nr:hypothetical protein GLOIN_2v1511284 [Rhizophagus clarus]
MENQASLVNTEATTTDEINTDPISNTQNIDIYEVQPERNKALKLLALHILKHLPDDILREELDVSSIKSNEAIPDYGPCMECDIPILTEDPLRSLILNVCGDMIHRTCAGKIHKDGTLLCSCGKADHSDPLLPFQYSIVDYGGREKSSIPESERPSLVNLRNLGYNILKSLKDKTVRDIDFPELGSCSECGNDILMFPLKAACPAPDCGKSVDILDETGIISNPDPRVTSQSSGISPSMETFALSSPPIRMLGIEGPVTQQDKSTLRCAKCSEDLSSSLPPLGFLRITPQPQGPSKLLVYLTCKHIVHYNCIDNPRKLCPICPSTNDTETDDMETDDDETVTNNFEIQGSSTTQNKRTMEPASTEKSSSKKEELENMFDRFKSLHRDRKAQRMLIKEVTKQLPSDLSKNTIEKKIERARKIYDLFSTIGFDKIQRVKTPVSHIYGLSWEDIDTLGEKFR